MIDVEDIKTDIDNSEHQIRHLQSETIHCIAFKPSGKIEVVDKEHLENLNGEIDRLQGLTRGNGEVLDKLTAIIGEGSTVQAIRNKKQNLEKQIEQTRNNLRLDIGDLVKNHFDVDPEHPYNHPEGRKLKENADSHLEIAAPLLSQTADLLTQAEGILQEFKPSGVQAMPEQHPGLITRAKTGGMA